MITESVVFNLNVDGTCMKGEWVYIVDTATAAIVIGIAVVIVIVDSTTFSSG